MHDYLIHYGTPRHSGRYPWGSGERPYQGDKLSKSKKEALSKEKIKKKQISESYGVKYKKRSNKVNLLEEIIIEKGSKVQHISGINFDEIRKGNLYVTYDQYDNILYKALLGGKLANSGYSPKEVSLELSKDLKAPSSNRQFELYQKFKDQNNKALSEYMDSFYKTKEKERPSDEKDEYIDFTESLEKTSNIQTGFYNLLRKEGYNAILDEHDRLGSWMQAKRPLILMDAINTIGNIKIKDISREDIILSLEQLYKKNTEVSDNV